MQDHAFKRILPWGLGAVVVLALVSLVVGKTSCQKETSAAGAEPSAGAQRVKLGVGVGRGGGSDLVLLASALGYFGEEGLDVELRPSDRGWAPISALANGRVDVAIADDIALATERFARRRYVIFATVGHEEEHLLAVARSGRGVGTAEDLRGKRIAVEPLMEARYLTHRFLAAHGVADHDVETVEVKGSELHTALSRGDVDAIVDPFADDHPAVRRLAHAQGEDVVAILEPGSYPLGFEALASPQLASKNPAAVRVFVHALLRALDYADAHREEAERNLARSTGKNGRAVARDWRRLSFQLSLDQSLFDALADVERWAHDAGYLQDGQPPFAQLVDPSALRAERPAVVTFSPPAP